MKSVLDARYLSLLVSLVPFSFAGAKLSHRSAERFLRVFSEKTVGAHQVSVYRAKGSQRGDKSR
jgi:hypothetical protein